jgi:hypothetical protein
MSFQHRRQIWRICPNSAGYNRSPRARYGPTPDEAEPGHDYRPWTDFLNHGCRFGELIGCFKPEIPFANNQNLLVYTLFKVTRIVA